MSQKYNILDIVEQDLCTGCGICVSESSSSLKMGWNEFGFLVPQKIGDNINQDAIRVCPFNPNPDEDVFDEDKLGSIYFKKATHYDPKIGRFENTYVGYANEYRKTSSSGGIATYVFRKLLEEKIVENLFIVKEVNGSYEYQLFNDINDITKISKTRYIPVTLEGLFSRIHEIEGRIAISGVACFIKAIRLKQHYHPELKDKIPFLIGIICGGLKSKFFTDYLAQKSGISSNYSKQEYRLKDAKSKASDYSFGAYDKVNSFHQIKMETVGDMWGTGLFKSNACDFCDDVTTELADISLGDAWLDPYYKDGLGTSVIVTRTNVADKLISDGIKNNDLAVNELSLDSFKMSQKGSFNHRHIATKYRLEYRKKNGLLIPKKRSRLLEDVPFEFKRVQNQRMITRSNSLKVWKKYKSAKLFDDVMQKDLSKLHSLTRQYHRLQKVRRIFKLKVI